MHIYASPRRGYCASCDLWITDRPVYRMDETYCCVGCAHGGPCICTYEQDVADDGVDHLGLPFVEAPSRVATGEAQPQLSPSVPSGRKVGVR
ncbi:MAG: hypothetical protein ABIR11_07420 [Candidatus Limnocylindrales bacterium]